jgi:hypothetical protein
VRTLARQARRVLGHPRHRSQALRHHHRMERRFHRHLGRGMARPHWRWRWINGRRVRMPYRPRYRRGVAGPRYAAPLGGPGVAAPAGRIVRGGVARAVTRPGAPGVRYGRTATGQCVCPPCPTCGAPTTAQATTATAAPTPAYCRCCGQLLR